MSTEVDFFQQVRDALSHLYDYRHLENHPLTRLYWPEEQDEHNQAQRLHRLLVESIEELHPAGTPTTETSRAEYYLLLVYRYVEERPLQDIMKELGHSRRHFFRQQNKALKMLAGVLQEKAPAAEIVPESVDQLDDELERFRLRRRAIDPLEALESTLDLVERLARQHQVSCICDLPDTLPLIYGSRTVLRQIFLTSLGQLITLPDSGEIHLYAAHRKSLVVVEITANLAHPQMAEQGFTELESVDQLIQLVGGSWSREKLNGQSVVWRFDFPANVEKTLLVVDDNEGVINAFRRYLVGHNYRVTGATSGAEAIQLAQELQPAIITLDVMIPGQDGWEILYALKRQPDTQDIPVVICSVLQDPNLAQSLGAAAYLRKPVTQPDLLAMLERLTGTS